MEIQIWNQSDWYRSEKYTKGRGKGNYGEGGMRPKEQIGNQWGYQYNRYSTIQYKLKKELTTENW
jgi:hypothetical protein